MPRALLAVAGKSGVKYRLALPVDSADVILKLTFADGKLKYELEVS